MSEQEGAVLNDTTIVSDTVEIDAPQELVWSVIVDFERYGEWNPYTFRVDAVLELGAEVLLHLPDPSKPGESFTTLEHMRVIDAPHHLQYDTGSSFAPMLAIRDQWVEDLGNGRSSYRTTDVFQGPGADAVFAMQQEWVTAGFNVTAYALKDRAEKLWTERS
jgi:uncharacterized protein YndB with AHSA1/START domain